MLRFEDLPEINSERWLSLENLEGEEWRDVVGYENYYQISNYGRLKALDRHQINRWGVFIRKGRMRKIHKRNKQGYYSALLVKDKPNNGKVELIARLVAKAFIPNPAEKRIVDHINTIVADNRVCNLRWTTDYENAHNQITEKRVKENAKKRVGTHLSDKTKKLIRETKIGSNNPQWGKKGSLNRNSIPIIQLTLSGEFVKEWECIRAATDVYKGKIDACCKGKRLTVAGYKWKYKKDYYQEKCL